MPDHCAASACTRVLSALNQFYRRGLLPHFFGMEYTSCAVWHWVGTDWPCVVFAYENIYYSTNQSTCETLSRESLEMHGDPWRPLETPGDPVETPVFVCGDPVETPLLKSSHRYSLRMHAFHDMCFFLLALQTLATEFKTALTDAHRAVAKLSSRQMGSARGLVRKPAHWCRSSSLGR